MDGKANKEGGAFERKSLRRPQFAPGQDALLDSAPPSDSLAQAFSTNPAAIRARKAREESRAQHGPPVKGPQAPAITGRVRVVATTNAASPGVAALHNGRTGVVTKRAAGWIEVQLDATRDKPSETIPCRKRDLVKIDEAHWHINFIGHRVNACFYHFFPAWEHVLVIGPYLQNTVRNA